MIYICIPTHNEQQTVGVILWKLRQVFGEYPRDYQLLVAEDASTDKTAEVLEPYTRVLPLTVIRSEKRQGHAASLEMLLREAVRRSEYPKRDVVVTLQADFSEEPDDLVALLKRMEAGADVAAGNKVGKTREPRMRRLSRSLAKFFMRGVKWPEGLATPFDGYRAYRLYALKRAFEESGGRRVMRYDGWAAHAELLRAVLPHARRVDVVDVVDRTDRMQRPRREQPLAAAMQVRAMTGKREPPGLVGVEELDRIAASASKVRERPTLASMAGYAQRAPATNGGRRGDGRQRRGEPRRRDAQEPRGERPSRGGERQRGTAAAASADRPGEPRQRRPRSGQPAGQTGPRAAGDEPRRRPPRGAGSGEEPRPRRPRAEKPAAADTPPADPEAAAAIVGDDEAQPARPKKRRRRRRKTGGAASAAGAPQADENAPVTGESGAVNAVSAGDPGAGAEGAAAEGEAGGEKKRRRRGGRRGGRGRKRSGAQAQGMTEEGATGVADGVDSTPAAAPVEPAPERSDND